MATAAQKRRRAYWRWLKVGFTQVLPYPGDEFDVQDWYMLNNSLWVLTGCTPTEFQEMLDTDVDETFLQEFAITAYYETYQNVSFPIKGIWDDPYMESLPETQIALQSQGPKFRVDENDLPPEGVHKGDKLLICNKKYEIIHNEPDGTGINDLILHEVLP